MVADPTYDFFLSYNRSDPDRIWATHAQSMLVNEGFRVFWDSRDLPRAEARSLDEDLVSALDSSGATLIFVGRAGLGNGQVLEVAHLLDREKAGSASRLYVVRLGGLTHRELVELGGASPLIKELCSRLTFLHPPDLGEQGLSRIIFLEQNLGIG